MCEATGTRAAFILVPGAWEARGRGRARLRDPGYLSAGELSQCSNLSSSARPHTAPSVHTFSHQGIVPRRVSWPRQTHVRRPSSWRTCSSALSAIPSAAAHQPQQPLGAGAGAGVSSSRRTTLCLGRQCFISQPGSTTKRRARGSRSTRRCIARNTPVHCCLWPLIRPLPTEALGGM